MQKTSVSLPFGNQTLTLETGELAPQATVAVLARLGDTVVLVTVVEGNDREDLGYFPLSVEFAERLYAGGKIKGSRWVKREGRPSDEAILTGRLIDRSIRPLFPKEYKKEVQVIATVLSVDGENEPDILALNAVSAALAASPIPWNGPVGAIRIGHLKDGEHLINPTTSEIGTSELDIVVSQNGDKTVMIEAGAHQVSEDIIVSAIEKAHVETAKMIEFINDFVKKVGMKKHEVTPNTKLVDLAAIVEKSYKKDLEELAGILANKESGGGETGKLIDTIFEQEKARNPEAEIDKKLVSQAVEKVMFKIIRSNVVNKQKRPDGRAIDEIRPLEARVGILPRTHGSAVFQRGITQALTIATLGSPRLEQLIESAEGEESKRYIHHYAMPPYSVGETGRIGSPSRREIGHGALAERALEPVIPGKDVFPYTIRVVSEILSSNGSTSMASTCGSTLALMDAGVPILKPVGGISVGMMSEGDKYVLLTDIIGLEDFSGDMDFKVAGTDDGVTAIQLDVKIPGLTVQQIKEIFERAKTARMKILETMLAAIDTSRSGVSQYAPKIQVVQIPIDKIGEVIGPGGRVIKNIIAQTGAEVDVEDDGSVTITSPDKEAMDRAVEWIKSITREVMPNEEFDGEVKRILPFGAFVEILPGKEGMVHVSQMSNDYVKNPEDVVALGDKVKVKVIEIDDQGRINLTMKLNAPVGEGSGGSENRGPRNDSRSGGGMRGPRGPRMDRPRRDFDRRDSAPRRDYGRSTDVRTGDTRSGGDFQRDDHPLSRQFRRERMTSSRTPYGKRGR